jgi:ABC-type cobalamin/Fe3+-siderophores transport system ATPase subunit
MNEGIIVMEGEKSEILTKDNIREIFKIDSVVFPTIDRKSINVLINPNSFINTAQN